MPRRIEETIQRAVVNQLHARAARGLVWWHTPNGGKRNPIVGAIMKAMGTKAGVADLLLFKKGNLYALEIKAPGGRATESQLAFLGAIDREGGYGAIAEGLDQAIATLERWELLK